MPRRGERVGRLAEGGVRLEVRSGRVGHGQDRDRIAQQRRPAAQVAEAAVPTRHADGKAKADRGAPASGEVVTQAKLERGAVRGPPRRAPSGQDLQGDPRMRTRRDAVRPQAEPDRSELAGVRVLEAHVLHAIQHVVARVPAKGEVVAGVTRTPPPPRSSRATTKSSTLGNRSAVRVLMARRNACET